MPIPLLAAAAAPFLGGMLPALGGAAAGALSSITQNLGAKKRQNEANEHNIKFWGMQNDYNHPSAQMARLREAGLNPNLIYGTPSGAAVGNAEKIAPSKAAPYDMKGMGTGYSQGLQAQQIKATTDNLRAQNTVIEQERQLKIEQQQNTRADTLNKTADVNLKTGAFDYDLSARQETMRQAKEITAGLRSDTQFKEQSVEARVQMIGQELQNSVSRGEGQTIDNALKQAQLELRKIGIEVNDNKIWRILGINKEAILKSYKNYRKNNIYNRSNKDFKN